VICRGEGKIVGIGGKFFKLNCLSKKKMETLSKNKIKWKLTPNNSFITIYNQITNTKRYN
jgi:hypothetical protein